MDPFLLRIFYVILCVQEIPLPVPNTCSSWNQWKIFHYSPLLDGDWPQALLVWSLLAADIHPGLYKFSGEDPEQAVGMMLINDSHFGNDAAEVAS